MMRRPLVLAALLLALAPRAQEAGFAPDPLSPDSLRTTLEFLTDDALGGRDTPSLGLAKARDYLVARVQAAGLLPGVGTEFLHRYELPGSRLDGSTMQLTVWATAGGEKVVLQPGKDVRVWRADSGFANQDVEVVRLDLATPGADRLTQRQRGQRPVLLEVDETSPLWQAHGAVFERLSRRGSAGAAPTLLVRRGRLPQGELHAALTLPAPEATQVALENVVATLPCEGATEWVVFSAHYDHIGIGAARNGDSINNGADDDASGSAAVLALAEVFASQKPKLRRNLAFVWFSAEEKGLRGSFAFVAKPPFPLASIAAVVNLEMLGRPPVEGARKAWVTGHNFSDFATIAAAAMQPAGIEIIDFAMAGGLFSASDNLPFAQQGVVAHSISAGSLHQDYHQPSDELKLLDLDHMSAVVRGLYAFGVELGTRAARPAFNERGRKQLRLDAAKETPEPTVEQPAVPARRGG